jgi:hypothetical protein
MWKSKVETLSRNGRKRDLDRQSLLKRLRHERYAETGRYQAQQAKCAIRLLAIVPDQLGRNPTTGKSDP